MKFTEPTVARIPTPDTRDIMIFDDALPGFGIRKFSTGKSSYFVKYSMADGKQRKITLGTVVPGVLSDMRRNASDIIAQARMGKDTSGERKIARAKKEVAFADIIPLYLKSKLKELRPTSYAATERYLGSHWKPLHATPIEAITRRQIALRLDQIVVERGPVAADRARAALTDLFGWAIERSYLDASPAAGIKRRSTGASRKRVLSEAEIADIWRASDAGDDYANIIRLLILTGQRKTEISDVGWSEIDLARNHIDLPSDRTKNKLPHLVPLAPPALEIIRGVPAREGRELLFGARDGGFQGWSGAKTRLNERLPEDMQSWVVHDIRRSMATHMAELGFAQPHVVEAILNHVSGSKRSVAGVYNRALYLAERREALNRWADRVLTMAGER